MSSRPRYIDLPRRGVVNRCGGVHSAASASAGELRWKRSVWCGCADGVCFEQQISRTGVCGSVDREVEGRRSDDNGNFEDFKVVLASWRNAATPIDKVLRSPKALGNGGPVNQSQEKLHILSADIKHHLIPPLSALLNWRLVFSLPGGPGQVG